MKGVNFVILKKRFFLLLLLIFVPFFMNLFLWNETSQLIRQIPVLANLSKMKAQNLYEISYVPKVDDTGEIQASSEAEQKGLLATLKAIQPNLYLNNGAFFTSKTNDTKVLTPVTAALIQKQSVEMDPAFLNDLILVDPKKAQVSQFAKDTEKFDFTLRLVPIAESYQTEYDYYFGNFIFGAMVALGLFSFNLLLIYLMISSSIKISLEEIKLLRIMGLSKRKIKHNFEFLLLAPVILAIILFVFFARATPLSLISMDYFYLSLLNVLLSLLAKAIIDVKLNKELAYD